MKSRKMPKALGQSYQKFNINQTLCPALPRIFFKCEKWAFSFKKKPLSAIPNHSCLYSHVTVEIQYVCTQTAGMLYILKHQFKEKRAYANKKSEIISSPNKVNLSTQEGRRAAVKHSVCSLFISSLHKWCSRCIAVQDSPRQQFWSILMW